MYGASGKVCNLVVFKNFGSNQTVIAKRPKERTTLCITERQLEAKLK